mmetsp:Transcript_1107/g.3250  ORF Transcript_1107/g.3250 Transcript_1107/m.3250 type:complete len:228 (+) Transcript_1107:147-830(+)
MHDYLRHNKHFLLGYLCLRFLLLLLLLNRRRGVLCWLLDGDQSQSTEDPKDGLVLVQGVHVESWSPGLDESFAHLRCEVDAVLLHRLWVVLDWLERVENLLGHLGLAEPGHAHEAAIGLDGHDSRQDRAVDPDVPAVLDKLEEGPAVVEELRDDHLAAGVNLLLQILELPLVVLRELLWIVADGIRVGLWVAGHADAEEVAVLLPNEFHEIEGALKASLDGLPLFLA